MNSFDYWQQRWINGATHFDEPQPHRYLQAFITQLDLTPGASIFVPLCGKSVDMHWLATQGYQVLGVEFSEHPIQRFFAGLNLKPTITPIDHYYCYTAGPYTLYHADLFAFSSVHLQHCTGFYDRGSLVALETTHLRPQYIHWMKTHLPTNCRGLLIAWDFAQQQKPGPPFVIAQKELTTLMNPEFQVQCLQQEQLPAFEHWQQNGLQTMQEAVYLLQRSTKV